MTVTREQIDSLREQLLGPARDWQERHRQGSFVTTPDQFVDAVLALPAMRDWMGGPVG